MSEDYASEIRVEFKKLYEDSILPKKAHESDAGFDLYARSHILFLEDVPSDEGTGILTLNPGERALVKCGFGMAIPNGYEAQIRPRSGLALKHGISVVNSPGTIDSGFRSEVGVILINSGKHAFQIKPRDRIAQMVIKKLPNVKVIEVDTLSSPSDRGTSGFGSTGR